MTEVVLRRATVVDAAVIAPFHVACWHEAFTGLVPQWCLDDLHRQDRVAVWRDRLAVPGDSTTMALAGHEVVGVARSGPLDEPGVPDLELRTLYVRRSHYGTGLSRRLVAAELGDRPASLWAFEPNARAVAFYRRTSWVPTGERRIEPWTGTPEIRMVRGPLSAASGSIVRMTG